MTRLKSPLALFLLCALVAPATAGGSMELHPTDDAMLYGNANGTPQAIANGVGPAFFAGADMMSRRKRGIIRFDVEELPPSIEVTGVQLDLVLGVVAGFMGSGCTMSCPLPSRPISLHRVTASWNEGPAGDPYSISIGQTGMGWAADTGDVTWEYRVWDTVSWSSTGGDFVGTPSATSTFGPIFPLDDLHSWSSQGMIDDVEAWIATPASNHGWIVIADLETTQTSFLGWWSKDGALALAEEHASEEWYDDYVPKLTVEWE